MNVQIRNQKAVEELLAKLSGPKAREAYANAITDAAKRVKAQDRKSVV